MAEEKPPENQPANNNGDDEARFEAWYKKRVQSQQLPAAEKPPATQPATAPAQPAASGNLQDIVRQALREERESEEQRGTLKGLNDRIAALEGTKPKKRPWFSPLFD